MGCGQVPRSLSFPSGETISDLWRSLICDQSLLTSVAKALSGLTPDAAFSGPVQAPQALLNALKFRTALSHAFFSGYCSGRAKMLRCPVSTLRPSRASGEAGATTGPSARHPLAPPEPPRRPGLAHPWGGPSASSAMGSPVPLRPAEGSLQLLCWNHRKL